MKIRENKRRKKVGHPTFSWPISAISSATSYSITLHKQRKETVVGVLFKSYDEGVRVAKLDKGGLAIKSNLKVGDKILSINGKGTSDLSAKETAKYLKSTEGQVEIVAESNVANIGIDHSAESTPLLISTSTSDSTFLSNSNSASLERKSWTWKDSFQDHVRVLVHVPLFFTAPIFLSAKDLEIVHLSINSINNCKFCANLHGELGRMAGVENDALSRDVENDAHNDFADFGYTFAMNNGFGPEVRAQYANISSNYGGFAGLSAEGIAYLMLWKSLAGNTIISFLDGTLRGNTKRGSNVTFEILFTLYFGPYFIITQILSVILKIFPSEGPGFISTFFALFLACLSLVWIIPYSSLSMLMLPFVTGTRSILDESVGGYLA